MTDFLWNLFELAVTVFEEFVIIHFICGFLGHDFSIPKGKIKYVSGSLVGVVIVTLLNYRVYNDIWQM